MSMKEAKKSALMGLIKSMNKKRHAPKPAAPVAEQDEDPAEEAAESPDEEAHEMELGQEDEGEGHEPGMEDMVKGFMKHGRERMPAPKHGASLTVIMAGSGSKRKK
jgi:hypothetical protein